jgi:serine/threonine protein kinase/tetratricopeptide (TPR) repeat protein
MGEVWQAQDTAADCEVAIKIPRPGSSFDPGRWLAAEAHTVARLNHPNLVALLDRTVILDGDGGEGTPGLVFEYISGRSLSLWTDRPRPWRWIRAIATQTLQALAYAHGRGIVHRDLKPSNILLSGDPLEPTVHLLDFGIAAWSAPVRGGDELPSSINLNPMGLPAVPGTRAYMAPEQLGGEVGDIGPWSDIYSLGVVLAELLLGKLPFPGETDEEMWAGRLNTRFSPPIQVLSDLGIPLRRFLLRMLAPDPAQRFGWAADARRSLPSSMIHDLTTPAPAQDLEPESTDVMLQAVRRPEDRDTDPDVGRHNAPIMPIVEGGSITLELAPAGEEEVHLPPSWAVDKPDPAAWNEGLDKVGGRPKEAAVPAVSYALLSMRDAPLTGRDRIWKEAWQHLASVVETKRPALLILEGPGGRGKTRFARELAAVAEEVGVARSHHVRFRGDGSGAGALRRLLHRVLRVAELPEHLRGDRVRRVLAEAGYPPEADLVPRLIAMLSPRQHARGPELEEATTAIELFTVLCRRRPLLLWLEDIDRASDRALVTWLGQLFRAEPDLPVAVVATKRIDDEQEEADPAWVMLRANAGTRVLAMEPLSGEAIASVLRFTAGASEALGLEISRWCKGDPRAAQQIARHLHETDRLRWHPDGYDLRGDTPSTAGHLKLGSILRARARDAVQSSEDSEATQTTLDLLSLVRERAHHGYLLQAARRLGVPSRRIEAALGPLVLGALVDVRDEGPRLAHTALADSIREGIDLVRRMEFHKAWAVVLEASSRSHGRAERLLEAAWNRAACGQDELAARDELEAAHLLRDRWEVKAAFRAADSARLRLVGKAGLLRPEEEADLQVLGSVLEHEVRTPPGSPSELAGALDMLQPLWVSLPPSIERCRADLVHAEALRRAGRPADARESLQRGLDGARAVGSTLWECRALTLLADSCRLEGDLGKADELGERAWALVQGLHDDTLTLSVLVARLPIGTAMGDVERTKLWLDKLRGHLRARASWQDLQNLWLFRGEVERISGRLDQARQAYQTALVLGRQRGLHNENILLNLAAMNLNAGDLDGARETLSEAAGEHGLVSPHSHELRTSRAVLRAELGIRSGRAGDANSALQDAEILQAQSPISHPILLESLQRSLAAADLDAGIAERVGQLRADMQARLKLGRRRRR